MLTNLPAWALELAGVLAGDDRLPIGIDGVNVVLNRPRLARFLAEFANDPDVLELLKLDALSVTAALPLSCTGLAEPFPGLALRPFRVWEYIWLYRVLGLSAGGLRLLDLGGSATHLTMLGAQAGCLVTTLDINSQFVAAAQESARELGLNSFDARIGDMRDLSVFPDDTFDAIVSCSVLEHLSGRDQELALREMARVLRPGGLVGLTFDFGSPAPGANVHLPPPHDPPKNAAEALRRFAQGGLVLVGNPFEEDALPGSLFQDNLVTYTVASLFLGKPPVRPVQVPRSRRSVAGLAPTSQRAGLLHRIFKTALRLRESREQADSFRFAANDRQASLKEKEQVIQELTGALQDSRAHLENLQASSQEKEQVIQELIGTLQDSRVRMEHLLALSQEKEETIQELNVGLQASRIRAHDLQTSVQKTREELEPYMIAAEERLTALMEKEQVIRELDNGYRDMCLQMQAYKEAADERLTALHEKEHMIQALEAAFRESRDRQKTEEPAPSDSQSNQALKSAPPS